MVARRSVIDTARCEATFPQVVRLRNPKQFQVTFSQGRRISTALFRLHAKLQQPGQRLNAATGPVAERELVSAHARAAQPTAIEAAAPVLARLGIAVSKRVAARAVDRNRIKRITRDSFRRRRMQLPCGDYVVLALREATGASPPALRAALDSLWERVIALNPTPADPTMPSLAPAPESDRG